MKTPAYILNDAVDTLVEALSDWETGNQRLTTGEKEVILMALERKWNAFRQNANVKFIQLNN